LWLFKEQFRQVITRRIDTCANRCRIYAPPILRQPQDGSASNASEGIASTANGFSD
jgi:hypothetical protein